MAKARKSKRLAGTKAKKQALQRAKARRKRKAAAGMGRRITGAVQGFVDAMDDVKATRRKMRRRTGMEEG